MADYNELVSIIVPVFNGQDYLQKCIESIQNQTYPNLEILVVNDGSTDGTVALCEKMQANMPNLRVLQLHDEGVSVARNRAMDAAKGRYLMFVDADDRLKPNAVMQLVSLAEKTDADVCGCRFMDWHTEEELESAIKKAAGDNSVNDDFTEYTAAEYAKEQILRGNCRCWSKLYKREIVEQVRFCEKLTIGEDMLFLVELLSKANKFVESYYEGYCYFRNPKGAMNRPFVPAYMNQILCWEMAEPKLITLSEELKPAVYAQKMIAIMLTVGKIAAMSGTKRKEANEYLKACCNKLRDALNCKEAIALLPKGYNLKVMCFSKAPVMYVGIYHVLQALKRALHR